MHPVVAWLGSLQSQSRVISFSFPCRVAGRKLHSFIGTERTLLAVSQLHSYELTNPDPPWCCLLPYNRRENSHRNRAKRVYYSCAAAVILFNSKCYTSGERGYQASGSSVRLRRGESIKKSIQFHVGRKLVKYS